MTPGDLANIDRFVLSVGAVSLFDYFEVSPETAEDQRDQILAARRRWAQGQQANPKYRQEALWIIKNWELCRSAILVGDGRNRYMAHLRAGEAQQHLTALGHFIEGAIDHGELGLSGVQKVLEHGARLGLEVSAIQQQIDQTLLEQGALRRESHDAAFVDHYEVLGIHATASVNKIFGFISKFSHYLQ